MSRRTNRNLLDHTRRPDQVPKTIEPQTTEGPTVLDWIIAGIAFCLMVALISGAFFLIAFAGLNL